MTDTGDGPKLGDIWRFPYLWHREALSGETEGRKQRPCVLALLLRDSQGEEQIMLIPITSRQQSNNPFALEIPEIEKKRGGLDISLRLWAIADAVSYTHLTLPTTPYV